MNIPMNNLNSISNYNQIFDKNLQQFNDNFSQGGNEFENILNQQSMALSQPPVVSGNIELNVGLENMGITPYEGTAKTESTRSLSGVAKTANDFGKAFENGINSVNNSQIEAERATEIMASGGDISVHEVMIASEKANLTMQMAIQMRNKIITAYNEIKELRF